MANVLGITAFQTDGILKEWWEWTLVAIISASGVIGVIAFVWTSYNAIRKLFGVSIILPSKKMSTSANKA